MKAEGIGAEPRRARLVEAVQPLQRPAEPQRRVGAAGLAAAALAAVGVEKQAEGLQRIIKEARVERAQPQRAEII